MSVVTHNGVTIPVMTERWDPSHIGWVDFAFPEDKVVQSVVYVLPDGWTEIDTRSAATVTDEFGVDHSNTYSVFLSTTKTSGAHIITARVSFVGGEVDDRSVRIRVSDT